MKRLPCSLISSMAVLALFACGGGGGGTSGGGTPVTPPQAVSVTEPVLPLELKVMPMDLENVSGVSQVGGPSATGLTYANGVLRFVAPADTGKQETLVFRFNRSGGSHSDYTFSLLTLQPSAIESGSDGDEESPDLEWSDLDLDLPSLVNVNILPTAYSGFVLSFQGDSGAKPSSIRIYLYNGSNSYDVTGYFSLDADAGTVSLKAGSKPDFHAKLSDKCMELVISGHDDAGLPIAYFASFFYGSNTVRGKVVDGTGATITTLTGKQVVLTGFNSGARLSAAIQPDGTYTIGNAPTDSYSLSLADTSLERFGSSLFLIESGGSTIDVDLTIAGNGISGARQPSPAAMRIASAPKTVKNIKVPEFSKNDPIEPRSLHALQAVRPPAAISETDNSITVSGAARDEVVSKDKVIVVAKDTRNVKVQATVSTAEYPTYTTQQSRYNDSWEFKAMCGGTIFEKSGSVNNTHADNGTHHYNKDIDVSAFTKSGPINCTISAKTVNIGDGVLPTTVSVSLGDAAGITINSARHVSGLFQDTHGKKYFNISIPLSGHYGIETEYWKWTIEVKYSPKDAEIKKMKLELLYNNSVHAVTDNQIFVPVGVDEGTLQATIDMPALSITPAGHVPASLQVTLKGNLKGKTESLTSNKVPAQFLGSLANESFLPLFEIRDVAPFLPSERRYGAPATDIRQDDEGGDGWGRGDMLAWLETGQGGTLGLKFNDISGQNAWQEVSGGKWKSMGVHMAHKGGYDTDARYWDENGDFTTAMNGAGYGDSIKAAILEAWDEQVGAGGSGETKLIKVINWIKANRNGLALLAVDSNIQDIYIGDAEWFTRALLKGKLHNPAYPDNDFSILDVTEPKVDDMHVPLGEWNAEKIKILDPYHLGHMHIRFKPDP
ncbi:MAG: carboxypeptidase regulatory-like domain-containing protein [Deltaproteobacteria bacterium]|nr:carboxypeptidase regulatory-like domain-containing protein [Deltaproteobacteria bacterium]